MNKTRPYKISGDPYAGEVMNIQREDDGTFYVEIPELEWSQAGLATPVDAARAGLDKVRGIVGRKGVTAKKINQKIFAMLDEIDDIEQKISTWRDAKHDKYDQIARYKNELRRLPAGMSEGLRELPEDAPLVESAMRFLTDESHPVKAVGFKLYGDAGGGFRLYAVEHTQST